MPPTKRPSSRSLESSAGFTFDFDPKHRVGHLLRRAYYRAKSRANAMLKAEKITPMQAAAIMTLHERSLSQAELGRAIGMEPANVHGLIARLQKLRLVTTRNDEHDDRKIVVALSSAGRARADRIARQTAIAAESTLDVFSASERETFLRLLARFALAEDG
jgi:DNA-binding MarR family transcriptional regulator